jgi:hypothetical protein
VVRLKGLRVGDLQIGTAIQFSSGAWIRAAWLTIAAQDVAIRRALGHMRRSFAALTIPRVVGA